MYVYEDNVIFEVIDEQYRPVPPGVYGDKVLITILISRTQGAQNNVNNTQLTDTIRRNLTAQNVLAPSIFVEHVDVIPKNATGKTPLIKAYRSTKQ
jgi:acyl-CoA synthetase (AMP-forming)/AMP-acid ligase II